MRCGAGGDLACCGKARPRAWCVTEAVTARRRNRDSASRGRKNKNPVALARTRTLRDAQASFPAGPVSSRLTGPRPRLVFVDLLAAAAVVTAGRERPHVAGAARGAVRVEQGVDKRGCRERSFASTRPAVRGMDDNTDTERPCSAAGISASFNSVSVRKNKLSTDKCGVADPCCSFKRSLIFLFGNSRVGLGLCV